MTCSSSSKLQVPFRAKSTARETVALFIATLRPLSSLFLRAY